MVIKHQETPFGALLREQGRRMAWVAKELDVDVSTVWRWCYGERPIPPARVTQLAALLGVEESEIVGDSNAA